MNESKADLRRMQPAALAAGLIDNAIAAPGVEPPGDRIVPPGAVPGIASFAG